MNALAVSIASRSGVGAAQVADLARTAEAAGFDAVFVAERAADSLALAHSALQATHRITVGTAIANAVPRHPVMTALTAASLAEESGGRFLLGLGVSSPALNEAILGLGPISPVGYMREYVGVLRAVLDGHPEPPPGEYFSVSGFVPDHPATTAVQVYLAGLQPRMLALAGELADGVFLNLMSVAALPTVVTHVEAGLARAERARSGFVVACLLPCCLADDAEVAARAARQVVAGYAMHPAAGKLFSGGGFGTEMERIRQRLNDGEENAAESVSDAMIDALVVHGRPDVLPGRVAAYREAGVDLPVLFPMPVDDGWIPSIRGVIEAAGTRRPSPLDNPPTKRKDA